MEQRTFEEFYRELYAPMTKVAYLMMGSRQLAEELVQDAFIRLYEHFDDVKNPGGFLRTVVTRLCINASNRQAMERQRVTLLDSRVYTDPDIDEMWDRLAAISADHRVVLVLRYYEDLSHREIARIIGRPTATVRTRVARALRELRRGLEC